MTIHWDDAPDETISVEVFHCADHAHLVMASGDLGWNIIMSAAEAEELAAKLKGEEVDADNYHTDTYYIA